MPARLICPFCRRTLTVSDNAPAKLTCPHCLAKLSNPLAGVTATPAPSPRPTPLLPLPVPVIPVDDQVAGDTRNTHIIFIALLVLLTGGAVLSAVTIGGSS